jgi:hypothetical protein
MMILLILVSQIWATPINWQYKKISSQYSQTQSKIQQWKTEFSDLFEDYQDIKITAVTIEKGKYTYKGQTTCPANDSRLTVTETFIRYICLMEDEEEICEEYAEIEMPDFDPCSEKLSDNKKKK